MKTRIGATSFDRDQPVRSHDELQIVRRFHEVYYQQWWRGVNTVTLSGFGHLLLKCPLDLWIYQELLVKTQPDLVIETGTFAGGSALYFAMLFDQIGLGRVITIDNEFRADRPEHPRIEYLHGSSLDSALTNQVREKIGEGRPLVVLDPHCERFLMKSNPRGYLTRR